MTNLLRSAVIALLVASAAAAPVQPGLSEMTHLSGIDGTEQPYGLYIPESHDPDGEPLPLVILLHGLGATWETYWNYLPVEEWAEEESFVVATPHGRGDWYYVGPGETDVLEVIEEVQRLCHVDPDRIYLIGHSMGGWGVWQLGVSHPDLFAAIIPTASWAPLDLLPNLRHTPLVFLHGRDDTVVQVEYAREIDAELSRLGIEHSYLEAPAWGHHSALVAHMLPVFGRWLQQQRRPATPPAELSIRTYTPRRGSSHWLRMLETIEFPDLASIDASFEAEDSRLRITTDNVAAFAVDLSALPGWAGESLTLWVDGPLPSVTLSAPLDTLSFEREGDSWSIDAGLSVEQFIPAEPVIAHLDEPLDHPITELCGILAEETGSDTGVIRDVYACPGLDAGDVTADEVLDLYLRPQDELYLVEMPASTLAVVTSGERNVTFPELPLDDPDRLFTVAMGDYQMRRLPEEVESVEPQGVRVIEVIFDHIAETGELP
ncbi:prolyl oligopeptidase family serine peptidase [Candidatus Sumerlaeota bacterium]|nr:prolyl oligopeptidase family serine peptidase [Candidatus Sumerlaeota bacterium]